MGGLSEAAIGQAIKSDRLAGRGVIEKITSRGRFVVAGPSLSAEIIYRIELKKGKEAEMGDVKCKLQVEDVGPDGHKENREVLIGSSPYCKGCKSRDHTLYGCGWLKKGLRLNNSYANQIVYHSRGTNFGVDLNAAPKDPGEARSASSGPVGEGREASKDVEMDAEET